MKTLKVTLVILLLGVVSALGLAPSPSGASSAVGGPITRSEIIARARNWLERGVVYNVNSSATDLGGKLYRQDCSGFVSMAWHLSGSPSTVGLGSSTYSVAIGNKADLKAGDILNVDQSGNAGHVRLFDSWTAGSNMTQYNYYELDSTGQPVHYRTGKPYPGTKGSYTYEPRRYKNVIEDVPTDGTFIKSAESATVYRVAGGSPVPLNTLAPFGAVSIMTVPAATIQAMLVAHPVPVDGTFVKPAENASVYRMAGGSPVLLNSLAPFGSLTVAEVNLWSIQQMLVAHPFPVDGTILVGLPSGQAWRVTGGKRAPVASAGAASVKVNDWSVEQIPQAEVVVKPGFGVVTEGNEGSVTMNVAVTLSNPSTVPVSVSYATLDTGAEGVATAGVDYDAVTGVVTFLPGETEKNVAITVKGDTEHETPLLYGEWVLVRFTNPSASATVDASFFGLGVGVVLDDD